MGNLGKFRAPKFLSRCDSAYGFKLQVYAFVKKVTPLSTFTVSQASVVKNLIKVEIRNAAKVGLKSGGLFTKVFALKMKINMQRLNFIVRQVAGRHENTP